VHDYSTYRRNSWRAVSLLGLLCAFAGGCSPGIRWRGYSFDRVHADSQRDQKLTFVYFRHWAVIACTDFEDNVLKGPAVLQATAELYCVPLDFYWDRPLAEEWGVEAPPGVVILDPQSRVLARLSGEISTAQLLEAIQSAKDEFSRATRPPASIP
jgi:hypothetical protein